MKQAEVAIVTGGGNGIGEAIVHQLVDDGFKVGVADMIGRLLVHWLIRS